MNRIQIDKKNILGQLARIALAQNGFNCSINKVIKIGINHVSRELIERCSSVRHAIK